jgi:hypothetical protein
VSEIRHRRGDDLTLDVALVNDDGTPADITGFGFTFTVKRSITDLDLDAVWQGSLGSGVAIVDAVAGTALVSAPANATAAWPIGTLLWDLQVIAGGEVHTIDSGKLIVLADVTRAIA